MPEPRQWPNVERLVLHWLTTRTAALVCTVRPEPARFEAIALEQGVVQVEVVGGTGSWVDHDVPIEVDLFTGSRGQLWDLADRVTAAMRALPGDGGDEGLADDVAETFLWAIEPHPNPKISQASGTFTITVRPL